MKQKVYIIGNSGSGKSYLAKILSKKYNCPHFDLDDIFWEKKYTIKRNEDEKKNLVSKVIQNNDGWIIEGVFTSFVSEAIQNADEIIWLDIDINLLTWRIIKRDFLKVITRKNSLKNLLTLIEFARSYKSSEDGYYFKIKKLLEKHEVDFILIKNKKEFQNYLKELE